MSLEPTRVASTPEAFRYKSIFRNSISPIPINYVESQKKGVSTNDIAVEIAKRLHLLE